MKTKRTLSILLICLMIVLTLAGCKKKEKEIEEETPVATATPEPVSVKELLAGTEAELKTLVSKSTDAADGSENYLLTIPNGSVEVSGLVKMKFNLLSLVKMDADINMSGKLTANDNVGTGDAKIDMSMVTSSMFSEEDETDTDSSSVKFYIDNTNGNEITVYTSEEEGVWTKSTKSIKDFVGEYTGKLEEYNVNVEDEKNSDLFKNREQFTADHTRLDSTADGYLVTTEFTWSDFYNAFKEDMDKLATEAAGAFTSALSASVSVEDLVKDFYGNGQGNFKMTANYDIEKNLKDVTLNVEDFALSAQLKLDEESNLPISFNIGSLQVKFTFDRDEKATVTIPEDVKANATEPATGVEDDYNWIIDNGDDDKSNTDDDFNTGNNVTDDEDDIIGGSDDSTTAFENGVYYMLVGGQTISFPFPEDWNPTMYDYSLDVYPEDNLMASYSDSYVRIEENAISSDLSYIAEYYETEYNAADYTITFNGSAQPSYVFAFPVEDAGYQHVLVYEYVPGSENYLEISIIDFTGTAELLSLVEKFGISF